MDHGICMFCEKPLNTEFPDKIMVERKSLRLTFYVHKECTEKRLEGIISPAFKMMDLSLIDQ